MRKSIFLLLSGFLMVILLGSCECKQEMNSTSEVSTVVETQDNEVGSVVFQGILPDFPKFYTSYEFVYVVTPSQSNIDLVNTCFGSINRLVL